MPPVLGRPVVGFVNAAESLGKQKTTVLEIPSTKPLAALRALQDVVGEDRDKRAQWLEDARIAAVMGSRPKSAGCFQSGLKCAH